MANVTGGDLVLKNKSKSYSIQTKGGMSQKYRDTSKSDFGSAYYLKAAKISGRIQGNLSYTVFSDKLDINDMGYLDRNNYKQIELYVSHQIVKPFWKFIQWYSYVDMYNWSIYNPSVFTSNAINLHSDFTFKNQYNAGTNMSYYPNGDKDYYEPRVKGRFVIPFHKQYHIGGWISTDPRKKISFYFNPGRRWTDEKGHYEYWFNGNIAYRMNDKFSFLLESSFDTQLKQKGWVRTSSNNDTINFGIRNVRTISNTITIKYIFTKSSYLGFRMRHYNQNVIYNPQYYNLNNDGTLNASLYSGNNNKCYNAFNIDMLYSWRFAPGSELSVAWKNIIETDENIIINPYGENIKNTINSPQTNSFSIKIIYYLDYLYLKKS